MEALSDILHKNINDLEFYERKLKEVNHNINFAKENIIQLLYSKPDWGLFVGYYFSGDLDFDYSKNNKIEDIKISNDSLQFIHSYSLQFHSYGNEDDKIMYSYPVKLKDLEEYLNSDNWLKLRKKSGIKLDYKILENRLYQLLKNII